MSTLAFDKQGKPFTFAPNTRKLLVRFFPPPLADLWVPEVADFSLQVDVGVPGPDPAPTLGSGFDHQIWRQ